MSLENVTNNEVLEENKALKEKLKNLELELATQKSLSHHFEGISCIAMAEMKKLKSVELLGKSDRLSSLFAQFNNEMRGFLADKQHLLQRFGRIENLYHCIVGILKSL